MKTGLLNNLYFAKDSAVKLQFLYCGTPSITGLHASKKMMQLEQSLQNDFNSKLIHEQEQWDLFKKSVLDNLENKFNNMVDSIKLSLPDYIFKFLKLLIPQIELQEENIKSIIENILKECAIDEDVIIVKISKNDSKWIKNLQKTFSSKKLTFELDESLSSGDVILKTSLGDIDAKLSTMLEELMNSIKNN